MFLGHYGVAFAAKRAAPRTSLGTLAFAAQFLDELWPLLLLVGIEHARIVPGLMAANPIDFVSYPISHSLLTAAGWGGAIGALYVLFRRDRRGGAVLAVSVLSHWFLDVPMHRPDLPLWPGASPMIGAGAWSSIPLTLVLDIGVFAVGLLFYVRATRANDRVGSWGLWSVAAVLVTVFIASMFGPPPASERALATSALGLWLFVPWMYWVDRHRTFVTRPATTASKPSLAGVALPASRAV